MNFNVIIFTLIYTIVSVDAAGMFSTIILFINFSLLSSVISFEHLTNLFMYLTAGYNGPTNQAGLDLIKKFEGWKPNFYTDPVVSKLFYLF